MILLKKYLFLSILILISHFSFAGDDSKEDELYKKTDNNFSTTAEPSKANDFYKSSLQPYLDNQRGRYIEYPEATFEIPNTIFSIQFRKQKIKNAYFFPDIKYDNLKKTLNILKKTPAKIAHLFILKKEFHYLLISNSQERLEDNKAKYRKTLPLIFDEWLQTQEKISQLAFKVLQKKAVKVEDIFEIAKENPEKTKVLEETIPQESLDKIGQVLVYKYLKNVLNSDLPCIEEELLLFHISMNLLKKFSTDQTSPDFIQDVRNGFSSRLKKLREIYSQLEFSKNELSILTYTYHQLTSEEQLDLQGQIDFLEEEKDKLSKLCKQRKKRLFLSNEKVSIIKFGKINSELEEIERALKYLH